MKTPPGTVLILGADGFIGRHLAFGLRTAGWQVIASARRVRRLNAMGFDTLQADLNDPVCSTPTFWQPHVRGVTHLINAAGVLSASEQVFRAVHEDAPEALYAALPDGARGVLLSAVGIDETDTPFALHRREGEEIAARHGLTILRAGLVLGDTSYGGSSLARALAAFPLVTPVVGKGDQRFNPIHVTDLTRAIDHFLRHTPGPGIHEIGGAEDITQADMMRSLRRWLGLRPVPVLHLPVWLARGLGRLGDAMRWGPISRSAVDQLNASLLARPGAAMASLPNPPRKFSTFIAQRPAGTQDLWHARLYLMRPALRLVLALLWLMSGLIGLFLPAADFLPLVHGAALSDSVLTVLARLGGLADLAIAAALLCGWRPRLMAAVQGTMVLGYTAMFSWLAPVLWVLPLGGLLKNLPLLALFAVQAVLEEER